MLKRVVSACVVAGGSWFVGGCDANVSNPTVDATRIKFYQSETNVVYVSSTDTLIAVYNDEQGAWMVDPKDPNNLVLIPPGVRTVKDHSFWVGQTYAGYSVLSNLGQNLPVLSGWQARGQIQPINPATCSSPPCPLILRGDPGVATNGTRVLYSDLAYTDFDDLSLVPGFSTDSERGPNAIAIAIDNTGTGSFGAPFVAGFFDETTLLRFADQPSISMLGDVAVVAFDDADHEQIWTVTTDDSSSTSWYAPMNFVFANDGEGAIFHGRAIIKLATATLAYLAYVTIDPQGTNQSITPIIMRLTRTPGMGDWQGTIIHSELPLAMTMTAPGAIGRSWRDETPMSFDLGSGGTELNLVFRGGTSSGVDDVFYTHCVDSPRGNCDTDTNWGSGGLPERFSNPQFSGSRFQPWVVADPTPGKHFAAVSWYQETFTNSAQYFVLGTTTGSDEPLPHTPFVIGYKDIGRFGFDSFSACPGGTSQGYYGDYESTAWTPYTSTLESTAAHPHWITTFSDSNQCVGGRLDDDQHVESAAW